MKKTDKLRVIIPLAILLLAGIGFASGNALGTLSSVGWESISVLCPLGALGTMIASKTLIPHAVVSLILAIIAIVLLGRAFCGWICPVPVWSKLRGILRRQDSSAKPKKPEVGAAADAEAPSASPELNSATGAAPSALKPLSAAERKSLTAHCSGSCKSCQPSGSRHIVLAGALLSTAIFGFPVFCLVCPIGLSFALVFVLIMLFGGGTVTWSVILIPVLLLLEVVFFRKWCSHICPLSSLMSLVGKLNRTFRPHVDADKCLESKEGVECGHCAKVCDQGIDPRHPENGVSWSECTKCRKCVETCPGQAMSMPFLPRSSKSVNPDAETR